MNTPRDSRALTPLQRVHEVAPVDAFVTDSDHWVVSKTDYDCLLDVARQLAVELERATAPRSERGRWLPWDGNYEKQFYDVRYSRCDVCLHCWPNAGRMVAMDGSGREWIPGDPVEIRVSEFQTLPPRLRQSERPRGIPCRGCTGRDKKLCLDKDRCQRIEPL